MSLRSSELRAALGAFGGVVRENASLAPSSHLRIGGPARILVDPFNDEDVAKVVRACLDLGYPLRVLGGGSNVLIADEGIEAVVLELHRLNRTVRDGDKITAGAGVTLPSLLRQTKDVGLAGLEKLSGIPAVVGGAVAMNAGTREGETFEHLIALLVVNAAGEIEVWDKSRLQPRYRDGGLGGAIVLSATFALVKDSPAAIYARFEASLKRRNATQPVTERSLGCVFKNPEVAPAAKLIDDTGCKLMREGGISVSAKHANYFVNDGTGTATQFTSLMAQVQDRVRARFGVELVPEIKIWR